MLETRLSGTPSSPLNSATVSIRKSTIVQLVSRHFQSLSAANIGHKGWITKDGYLQRSPHMLCMRAQVGKSRFTSFGGAESLELRWESLKASHWVLLGW
eukprot:122587-Amphidinium_carterae.1